MLRGWLKAPQPAPTLVVVYLVGFVLLFFSVPLGGEPMTRVAMGTVGAAAAAIGACLALDARGAAAHMSTAIKTTFVITSITAANL